MVKFLVIWTTSDIFRSVLSINISKFKSNVIQAGTNELMGGSRGWGHLFFFFLENISSLSILYVYSLCLLFVVQLAAFKLWQNKLFVVCFFQMSWIHTALRIFWLIS